MRLVVVALAAVAAVIAVNLVLLRSGSDRNWPAGRLSPIAQLPALPTPAPAQIRVTTVRVGERDD